MVLLIQIEIVKVFLFFFLINEWINEWINQECDPSCLRCYGPNENQCISCSNGTFLLNGECLNHCPTGYYSNSTSNICQCKLLFILNLFE